MPIPKLLLLGVIIGSNNLAASLALGTLGQAAHRFRIVSVFGIFEFCIPLVGIWIGQGISHSLARGTDWAGPLIIGLLGLWAIFSNFLIGRSSTKKITEEITTWSGLTILAAGLSIDNLLIGFSLGLGEINALVMAGTIVVFSVAFTLVGLKVGEFTEEHWHRKAEIGSGLTLIGLATVMAMGWI